MPMAELRMEKKQAFCNAAGLLHQQSYGSHGRGEFGFLTWSKCSSATTNSLSMEIFLVEASWLKINHTNKRGRIMKIKDFLEENKGKKIVIEVENGIIKKVTIEEMKYEIKNDNPYKK